MQQMLLHDLRPKFSLQFVPDLLVGHAFIDHFSDVATHLIGHCAGIDVTAREGIEHAGAAVAGDPAGTIDRREQLFDALFFRFKAAEVGGQVRLLDLGRRLRDDNTDTLAD